MEVDQTLQSLQATHLPVVLAADSNASIGWCQGQGELLPHGLDGKGLRMLDRLKLAPEDRQKNVPTSRPRKAGVKGRVIDFLAAGRVKLAGMTICEDSCNVVGTDHDMVLGTVRMQGGGVMQQRFDTKPRYVVGNITATTHVDQKVLSQWPKTVTKPAKSQNYFDSPEVKQLFRQAKPLKTAEAWKRAFKARQEDRKQWEEERLTRATQGDWKALKATRHRQSAWEAGFAEACEGEPRAAIHQHLASIYEGRDLGPWNPSNEVVQKVADFSLSEMQAAVAKGKLGKAVGPDGIPHELLVQVAQHDVAGPNCLRGTIRYCTLRSSPQIGPLS